jgi:hypothetical protein
MINMQSLMDDAKWFATVRDLRWPDGVRCLHGDILEITKQGRDDTQPGGPVAYGQKNGGKAVHYLDPW